MELENSHELMEGVIRVIMSKIKNKALEFLIDQMEGNIEDFDIMENNMEKGFIDRKMAKRD